MKKDRLVAGVLFAILGMTVPAICQNGGAWMEVTPSYAGPPPQRYAAMHFHEAQGVTVFFSNNGTSDTWTWDGTTWTKVATEGPPPREAAFMVYDSWNDRMVLHGGRNLAVPFNDTWELEWNDVTSEWVWQQIDTGSTIGPTRSCFSMAFDRARGKIVLFGGRDDRGPGGGVEMNDTWEFDVVSDTWTEVFPEGVLPDKREDFMMAYDESRGMTVMFGGFGAEDFYGSSDETWEWNGIKWMKRSPNGSVPGPRAGASLVYHRVAGKVILVGGVDIGGTGKYYYDTWSWDGSAWTEILPAHTFPYGRLLSCIAYDSARNRIVLFGGFGASNDLWEFNSAASDWTNIIPPSVPIANDTPMGFDNVNGGTYLIGTEFYMEMLTWLWDGSSWEIANIGGLPERSWPAYAVDESRGTGVLFGGRALIDLRLADTWEFDGTSWSEVLPASAPIRPPHRYVSALAYDSSGEQMILFGGYHLAFDGSRVYLGDTWAWKNGSWAELTPLQSPPRRYAHAMAWDVSRQELVLFGGEDRTDGANIYYNDTWVWKNGQWEQRFPDSYPSARGLCKMSYDRAKNVVVITGGRDPSGYLSETWEWNGETWNRVADGDLPFPLRNQGMAFDGANQKTVLFVQTDDEAGHTFLYLGPYEPLGADLTFLRASGEVVSNTVEWNSRGGPGTLAVYNGGLEDTETEKVSSSKIILNGNLIIGPQNFNQNVETIKVPINLVEGSNMMSVEVHGKPGGRIKLDLKPNS
jgi:N-acetylneuraminic acid mutarotase